MTASINNTEATAVVDETTGNVVLHVGEQSINLPVEAITSLVTAALAGRKAAYELKRTQRLAASAASRAERTAKASERKATAERKRTERAEKLRKQLAALEAKAAPAAKKAAKKAA